LLLKCEALENFQEVGVDVSGIVLLDSDYNTIIGCKAFDRQVTKTQQYGLREANTSDYNYIIGNDFRDNLIGGLVKVGTNTVVKRNLGYVTENSGTATIAAGTTSVTVAHGLAATPTKVLVTPRADIGDVWVSARDATNITINCDTAPVGDVIVDWYAEV